MKSKVTFGPAEIFGIHGLEAASVASKPPFFRNAGGVGTDGVLEVAVLETAVDDSMNEDVALVVVDSVVDSGVGVELWISVENVLVVEMALEDSIVSDVVVEDDVEESVVDVVLVVETSVEDCVLDSTEDNKETLVAGSVSEEADNSVVVCKASEDILSVH
jgi:hypothetical protein